MVGQLCRNVFLDSKYRERQPTLHGTFGIRHSMARKDEDIQAGMIIMTTSWTPDEMIRVGMRWCLPPDHHTWQMEEELQPG
ncbi:hypothetical protein R1flu_007228 [Riccia fluitans]|uniref:Uncharacterized protein n=1 Tax=Riccia fluitans TaxID=41844 RepID=A0ABD1YY95_9MARC